MSSASVRWTAIVVTCRNELAAQAIQTELQLKREKGELNRDVILLTVEDPPGQVGSGGATLNALLVVCEHISAKLGYSVVNSDILSSSLILIIHAGRQFTLDQCGRAFAVLPLQNKNPSAEDCGSLVSNFDILLATLNDKLACSTQSGVWICSSDMFFDVTDKADESQLNKSDMTIICVPASVEYAREHGVCHISNDGTLRNILYRCQSADKINQCKLPDGNVPLVSGVVYVKSRVAESLLGCLMLPPLDSCTYLGVDSGSQAIQLSLFFDFLLSACTDTTEEVFLSGLYGNGNTESGAVERNARCILWKRLNHFQARGLLLDGYHSYMDNSASTHLKQILSPRASISAWNFTPHCHSYITNEANISRDSVIMNSIIGENVHIGSNSVISHCLLNTNNSVVIGDKCIINGLTADHLPRESIKFSDEIVLQVFPIKEYHLVVFFGSHDQLFLKLCAEDLHLKKLLSSDISSHEISQWHPKKLLEARVDKEFKSHTFCNKSFTEFLSKLEISVSDIWDHQMHEAERSIWNAQLFGGDASSLLIQIIFTNNHSKELVARWKSTRRLSLEMIFSEIQMSDVFVARRDIYYAICQRLINDTLLNRKDFGLNWIYRSAAKESYSQLILETLDKVGVECKAAGIAARTLANIADVLGAMAGGEGGLRSGPACNKQWMTSFHLLEEGHIEEGFEMLAKERSRWLTNAAHLIRAARHYEGAAQILIRQAVMSARKFIHTTPAELPTLNQWVIAECPARIDIAGGWSDTPPITYEHGGAVLNAAILLNGKKPIGAKARRIERGEQQGLQDQLREKYGGGFEISTWSYIWCEIVLHLDGEQKLLLTELSSLQDYNQPHAPGALLKAALLCSELVKYGEGEQQGLQDQLREKYGGGFEISTWSHLPHGSGLGTSSILAGAVLAVLWRCSGKTFDIDSLNHAVLHLEQILTTGGGWQDQVGGLTGGIKLGHSKAEVPVKIEVDFLNLPKETVQKFSDRLILVYTGKTRLARNLLQNVIRNWYARNPLILDTQHDLVKNAHACAEAFKQGDLELVGSSMSKYWEQKKIMAPGCEPEAVKRMSEALRPHLLGWSLAGAGGGGFMYLLTREPNMENTVRNILAGIPEAECTEVYEASVSEEGLTVKLDE